MLTPSQTPSQTPSRIPSRTSQEEVLIQRRVAELERRLGDPGDPGNPLRLDALLAADERGVLLAEAEEALAAFRLNAEFVPTELGGRLDRIDTLGRVLRGVFRRDASLGLGYGATTFLAAIAIWAAGTPNSSGWSPICSSAAAGWPSRTTNSPTAMTSYATSSAPRRPPADL